MTKKRVSLLFALMLWNAASLHGMEFGFFSGLFGLFKSAQTIFGLGNSISEKVEFQAKPSKGFLKRGLKWVRERFLWATRDDVQKLEEERDERVTKWFKTETEGTTKNHTKLMLDIASETANVQKIEEKITDLNIQNQSAINEINTKLSTNVIEQTKLFTKLKEERDKGYEEHKKLITQLQNGVKVLGETAEIQLGSKIEKSCKALEGLQKDFAQYMFTANNESTSKSKTLEEKLKLFNGEILNVKKEVQRNEQIYCEIQQELLLLRNEYNRNRNLRNDFAFKPLSEKMSYPSLTLGGVTTINPQTVGMFIGLGYYCAKNDRLTKNTNPWELD